MLHPNVTAEATLNIPTLSPAAFELDSLPLLDQIHADALRVLEEVGVRCVSPEVRALFEETGLAAYDDCQRLPCVVSWPAAMHGRPGGRTGAPFSQVDIPVTFLDAAGMQRVEGMQGVSQLPVFRGESEQAREWAIVEYEGTKAVCQQSFITGDYKLVLYRDADYGELYNM
ncbi:MAG: sulfatase/phosphatase domain-containing protein, partial [Desulfococcaceae bacterium]